MFNVRWVCALAGIACAACGESSDDDDSAGSTPSHAGTGGSSAGALGTSGTSGSSAGTAGGSAGTTASGGKAGGGSSGASSAGSGGGVAAPDCYPPCLWDLFENCRPTTSCIEEDDPASADSYTRCEAATGWRVEATFDLEGTHPDPDLLVTVNGQTCLTANYVEPTWTYQDPTGTVVATVTIESAGFFGRCPLLEKPDEAPVIYPVDDEDPRCAGLECTPGTCP